MGDPISLGIAGFSAASNALSMLSRFVDVRDEAKVLALKSELIGLLVEAQTAQLTLVEEKRQLAQRVRELEEWDGEKERYRLREVGPGVLAYVVEPEAQGLEPFHMLCQKCYQQRQKSLLQRAGVFHGRTRYDCHACRSEIVVGGDQMRALRAFPKLDGDGAA